MGRKTIISVAGVVMFLLAGALAMKFLPAEQERKPVVTTQAKPEAKPQIQQEPIIPEKPSVPAMMVVYVTGEVKRQGVYKFPDGARVYQAIDAAGGFKKTADSAALNLADMLEDKMHIHVEALGRATRQKPAAQGVRSSGVQKSRPSSGGLININTATAQELQALKGIGPALSKRIVEYREAHGAFPSPEDLINVKGIGPATLSKFRSQITVR